MRQTRCSDRNRNQAGFTGLEVLIVLLLFGLLAWLIVGRFHDLNQQARDLQRRLDIVIVAAELEKSYQQDSSYPADLASLGYHPQAADGASGLGTAFVDPDGQLIESSAIESSNQPESGFTEARPDGPQYIYAAYACQPEEAPDSEETESDPESEPEPSDPADDETTPEADSDAEETPQDFSHCSKYVLYSWLEDSPEAVFKKESNN